MDTTKAKGTQSRRDGVVPLPQTGQTTFKEQRSVATHHIQGSDWRYFRSNTTAWASSTILGTPSLRDNTPGKSTKGAVGPRVSRSMRLLERMVGRNIEVHNGRSWISVRINREMVGFRAGEFVTTTAWFNQEVSRTRGISGGAPARGGKATASTRKAKR